MLQNSAGSHSCIHQHVFLLNTNTTLRDLLLIVCCRLQQSDLLQQCTHSLALQLTLTPRLRLNEFQLYASSSLVILSNFPAHAEAKGDHVVLLTVPWAAALDVIQQRCLQCPTLLRQRITTFRFKELISYSHLCTTGRSVLILFCKTCLLLSLGYLMNSELIHYLGKLFYASYTPVIGISRQIHLAVKYQFLM